MANYEYSSYSSSSSGNNLAGGAEGAGGVFSQVDTNKDGTIDRSEFSNWLGNAAGGAIGAGGALGAGGSYESSSFSSGGAADAAFAAGAGGASSYESSSFSSGAGLDAGLGGASFQSSSFESAGGAGFDASAINQAAAYTSESNAAWLKYGAEVRGAGLYVDANPQIIRRQAPGGVQTYTQNIKVRFLQPPPVPPPGPLIIKEVRPPQPPPPPPLRIKQQAPPLPQPPPLILRERPPQPPASVASQTVIRKLAALPVPPRSVIIERLPAAPAPPRDIIIERWVPYGAAAKRKTIVQRAAAAKGYTAPRNVIIQYEPVQVRVVRQFQRLGVTQENPTVYLQRWGVQLLDAQTLVQQARTAGVVEDISPPAVAASSFSSSSFGQESSFGAGGAGGAEFAGAAGGEFGGASSSFSSGSFEGAQVGGGFAGGAGLEAGFGGEAGGSFGSSSFESSSFSSGAGGAGLVGGAGFGGASGAGFDVAGASFSSADTNKDGRLDAAEFNKFVQGGL